MYFYFPAASNDEIIAFVIKSTIKGPDQDATDLSSLADVIETLGYGHITNSSPLRTLSEYEAYSFFTKKGKHKFVYFILIDLRFII